MDVLDHACAPPTVDAIRASRAESPSDVESPGRAAGPLLLEESVRRLRARLAALQAVAEAVNAPRPLHEILGRALTSIVEASGAEAASIHVLTAGRDQLALAACRGTSVVFEGWPDAAALNETFFSAILKSDRPVRIPDAARDPRVPPALLQGGLRALVCAPLPSRDGAQGLLVVGSRAPDRFGDDDLPFHAAVANLVGGAIDRARLHDVARREGEDRRRTEVAWREADGFGRQLIECVREGIVLVDRQLRYLAWNPFMEQLSGVKAEAVLGRPLLEPFPELRDRGIETGLQRALAGDHVDFPDMPCPSPADRPVWVAQTADPLRDARGAIIGVVATVRDVTERRRAEEALRLRDAAIAASQVGFAIAEFGGRLTYVNPAFVALWGYAKAAEIVGRPATSFWRDARDAEAVVEALRHARIWQGELTALRKDGATFPCHVAASMVHDEAGRPMGMMGSFLDLTDRRRAESALRDLSRRLLQAQEEERRRIARDLHDSTAQKLAGLVMALGRLSDALPDPSSPARALAADGLAMAAECVREIRTLSHLLHPPLLDELGLETALEAYVEDFARQSGIAVSLDVPSDLGRLPRDVELALFRVTQEGLGNIRRHAGSPAAWVQLARVRDRVLLEIRDRGRGIPPDRLAEIRERRPPLGIGLAGMQERIEQLGGALEIESSSEGTTVRAVVPVLPDRP